jgi:hypothetical protein
MSRETKDKGIIHNYADYRGWEYANKGVEARRI